MLPREKNNLQNIDRQQGNRSKPKTIIWLISAIVIAIFLVILITGRETPAPNETSKKSHSVSSQPRSESQSDVLEEIARRKKVFQDRREWLAQQIENTKQNNLYETNQPETSLSPPQPVRTSTRYQRRTQRELIVLDSIYGMIRNGEIEKALIMLNEQRSLFPEESEIENTAFEVIFGCIKERNEETQKRAAHFVESHQNFRLNKHINRLCMK